MATAGHSVGRLDAVTGESRTFGPVSGTTSTRFYAAAATRNRLIFGGGEHGETGQLNIFLPAERDWIAVAVPSQDRGLPVIQKLAATDEVVVVAGTDWGASPMVMRYDFATGGWETLREPWLEHIRERVDPTGLRPQPRTDRLNPDVLFSDPDGKTIWLGSRFGLTRYRPGDNTMHTWFARQPVHPDDPPVAGDPPVRLFGVITAMEMLPNGRHLIVATDSRQSRRGLGGSIIGNYLFIFDTMDEQWVGYLPLTLKNRAYIGQLVAHGSELWLSTSRNDTRLMLIDTDAWLAGRP